MKKLFFALVPIILLGCGLIWYLYSLSARFLNPAVLIAEPLPVVLPAGNTVSLVQTEQVKIAVEGGALTAFYSKSSMPQSCAVILVHGEFSDHRHVQPFADKFLKQGCDTIAPDLRGYAESRNLPSTWGKKEPSDITKILEYVKARKKIVNNQIGLLGVSLGAVIAAKTAESHSDLAFVLLDSYPVHTSQMIETNKQALLGQLGANFASQVLSIAASRCDCEIPSLPASDFSKILSPVFLAHSKQDTLTSEAEINRLFGSLPSKKKNLLMPSWPAARTELRAHNPQVYDNSILRFLMTYSPDFLLKK